MQDCCDVEEIQSVNMEKNEARISVYVHTNAKHDEIVGYEERVLRIRIAAQPVKNKANRKLIEFLSKQLGVSKSRVVIEKGETSRRKIVVIEGMTQSESIKSLTGLI